MRSGDLQGRTDSLFVIIPGELAEGSKPEKWKIQKYQKNSSVCEDFSGFQYQF